MMACQGDSSEGDIWNYQPTARKRGRPSHTLEATAYDGANSLKSVFSNSKCGLDRPGPPLRAGNFSNSNSFVGPNTGLKYSDKTEVIDVDLEPDLELTNIVIPNNVKVIKQNVHEKEGKRSSKRSHQSFYTKSSSSQPYSQNVESSVTNGSAQKQSRSKIKTSPVKKSRRTSQSKTGFKANKIGSIDTYFSPTKSKVQKNMTERPIELSDDELFVVKPLDNERSIEQHPSCAVAPCVESSYNNDLAGEANTDKAFCESNTDSLVPCKPEPNVPNACKSLVAPAVNVDIIWDEDDGASSSFETENCALDMVIEEKCNKESMNYTSCFSPKDPASIRCRETSTENSENEQEDNMRNRNCKKNHNTMKPPKLSDTCEKSGNAEKCGGFLIEETRYDIDKPDSGVEAHAKDASNSSPHVCNESQKDEIHSTVRQSEQDSNTQEYHALDSYPESHNKESGGFLLDADCLDTDFPLKSEEKKDSNYLDTGFSLMSEDEKDADSCKTYLPLELKEEKGKSERISKVQTEVSSKANTMPYNLCSSASWPMLPSSTAKQTTLFTFLKPKHGSSGIVSTSDAVSHTKFLSSKSAPSCSKSQNDGRSHPNKSASNPSVPSLPAATSWKKLLPSSSLEKPQTSEEEYKGGPRRQNKQCPFYKKIPGTSITVDAFRYGIIPGCEAYVLTHFHYDHYGGLTKKFSQPIFCSQVTGNLVESRIGVNQKWINRLPLWQPCKVAGITLTMMEANHCPGAVIILFELKDGRKILHTGDFRASLDMEKYSALQNVKIAELYLDTTYCNPSYAFPDQNEVVHFVVNLVLNHIADQPSTLIVCGAYTIGKERIFTAIAKALDSKICVMNDKKKVLDCLEDADLKSRISLDWHAGRVHVLPMGKLNQQHLRDHHARHSHYQTVLAFQPTGWTHSDKQASLHDLKPKWSTKGITLYGVPYSEHSSYLELKRFVQHFRPQKILPTVNNGSPASRNKMETIFKEWMQEKT